MDSKNTMPKFCYSVVTAPVQQEMLFGIGEYNLDAARISLAKLLIKNECTSVLSVSVFLSSVKIGIYKPFRYIDDSRNPYSGISQGFQCRLHKTRTIMWDDLKKAVIYLCMYSSAVEEDEPVYNALSEYVYCLYVS